MVMGWLWHCLGIAITYKRFGDLKEQPIDKGFELSKEELAEAESVVENLDTILTQCFQYKNKLAILKTQLLDAKLNLAILNLNNLSLKISKRNLIKSFIVNGLVIRH